MLVKCSALFSYHAPPSPAPLMPGWPKYAASALLTRTSDGAILVALPVPIAATLEDGTVVDVQTEYPFQDIIRVSVAVPIARTASLPLLLRIPGWAQHATLSVDGGAPARVANGTIVSTPCRAGKRTQVTLELHPQIHVETGWGARAEQLVNDSVDSSGYSKWVGALPAGGDLHSGNYTVPQAEAWCNASAGCVGFTMRIGSAGQAAEADAKETQADHHHHHHHHHHHDSPPEDGDKRHRRLPPPSPPISISGDIHHVYFKGSFGPNADPGWVSYSKAWAAADTNAVAVRRGPLLFALQLVQNATVVKTWEPFKNVDTSITTPSVWNYALMLDPKQPNRSLTFERVATPSFVPFNSSAPSMRIRGKAVRLEAWREFQSAAAEPPPSPLKLMDGTASEEVFLIPYGATELRMGAMPWATPTNK